MKIAIATALGFASVITFAPRAERSAPASMTPTQCTAQFKIEPELFNTRPGTVFGSWEYQLWVARAGTGVEVSNGICTQTPCSLEGSFQVAIVARPYPSPIGTPYKPESGWPNHDTTEICQLWHSSDDCDTNGGLIWQVQPPSGSPPTDGDSHSLFTLDVTCDCDHAPTLCETQITAVAPTGERISATVSLRCWTCDSTPPPF